MSNPVPVTLPGVTVEYWPQQSPIDLTDALDVSFRKNYLKFKYPAKVVGNFSKGTHPDDHGFNLVLKPDSKAFLILNGQRCRLKKLHFHHESEHLVNGKRYPLEVHLVHEIEDPKHGSTYAVVGVFLTDETKTKTKTKTPKSFRSLTDFLKLPALQDHLRKVANREAAEPPAEDIEFNPNNCLPDERQFFRYEGSLTTTPFAEAVSWIVFRQPIEVADDVEIIKTYASHDARQPQELARRFLLRSV